MMTGHSVAVFGLVPVGVGGNPIAEGGRAPIPLRGDAIAISRRVAICVCTRAIAKDGRAPVLTGDDPIVAIDAAAPDETVHLRRCRRCGQAHQHKEKSSRHSSAPVCDRKDSTFQIWFPLQVET